jgi:ATP-binding protein involved in chromosome partitioning
MSMNPFERQAPVTGIKRILAVGSGKGGVGKSTVSANLALALKAEGRRVGLLDADVYGPSIPRLFGAINQKVEISPEGKLTPLVRHGVKLMSMGFMVDENRAVVWRGPMLFKAFEQFFRDVAWGELDDLVIDLPPGTGDVALTIAQKVPVSGAIVVCTPQNLALVDAKKAVDMFAQIQVPMLGVIENMSYFQAPGSDEKVQLFPKGELNSYLDARKIPKLGELPFDPLVGLACEAGIPTVVSSSDEPVTKIFRDLARKLIEMESVR